MMKEAEVTGKTYVVDDLRYSNSRGFHDKEGNKWTDSFRYLNDLLNVDRWEELRSKKMTLREVELELGYPIEIVSE